MSAIILTNGNERISPVHGMFEAYCEEKNISEYDILEKRKKAYFFANDELFLISDISEKEIMLKKSRAKIEDMDIINSRTNSEYGWLQNI